MYDDVTALRDFYETHLASMWQAKCTPYDPVWQADASCCNVMVGYGIGWLPPLPTIM